MKMKKEHFDYLKSQMLAYPHTPLLHDYLVTGLSEQRWRWDWMHRVPGLNTWLCKNLYSYLNDDHIDTALKKISNPNYLE